MIWSNGIGWPVDNRGSGRSVLRSLAMVGAVGAGVYVLQRARAMETGERRVIDWDRVRTVAVAVANRGRRLPTASAALRQAEFQGYIARTEPLIAEYLQTTLPQPLQTIYVFDRSQWIDANIRNFRELFEPLERVYGTLMRRVATQSLAPIAGMVNGVAVSAQMGLLLGSLARRVLGQYDVALLGREPLLSGKLYFVEENIAATERLLGIPPEQFRLWIGLHEATHAYEFEAHPWLAEYLNGRIAEHMQALTDEVQQLRVTLDADSAQQMVKRVASRLGDRGHWLELFMSDQQKDLFRQLQALMCLLEGYSNHVMDHIGALLMPDYGVVKERFEARRSKQTRLDKVWNKITGLEMKLEQYVLGETFVNAVVAARDIDFMNRAFTSPQTLPDMAEIREPARWIRRMDGAAR
ncbi:MAG TPA: zinc-dependent metalloprotease [Chloroflexota bacterium]